MIVQREERALKVLESVQWESQMDTFWLVLVQKAKWRVLHFVGVQMAYRWSTWVVPRFGTRLTLWRLAIFCITLSRGFDRGEVRQCICQ